jgi:inactivated superfamily I helicase
MQLVLDDEEAIPLPLDEFVREAWMLQYSRASFEGAMDGFVERLAACFASSLVECLDPDLKPPTDAQLKYATAIARDLGVALPSEALRFRGAMAEFIYRFVDAHKRRRRS